jgi:hypothetical protein
MSNKIKNVFFYFGLAAQLIGFVSLYKSIVDNPYYSLIIVFSGFVLISLFCYENIFKKEIIKSQIMDSVGDTYQYKKNSHSAKHRTTYGFIFLLALIVLAGTSFKIIKIHTPVANSPLDVFDNFKKTKTAFNLVNIYHVAWIGGGAFATVGEGSDEKNYPYASIINQNKINIAAGHFSGTACALVFDIETRNDIPWVSLDQVRVKVINYTALPKYDPIFPAPFEEAIVYYVELDNPKVAKTNIFMSDFIIEKGKRKNFGGVRLKKEQPEKLVVRINAKTPGIYTLQCELIARHENDKETVTLTKVTDWLFDGQY